MTEDQLEWERRSRVGKRTGILGGLLLSPGLALCSPDPFHFDIFFLANMAGLMVCLALLGFYSPPGRFHEKFPGGIPPVPAGNTIINENGPGGCCLWGCFGIPLTFLLPLCWMCPLVWLALLGACVLLCQRVQYRELVAGEGTMTTLVTWGGLLFRQNPRQLLALACVGRKRSESNHISYRHALIFEGGQIEEVANWFFRANSEQPIPGRPVLEPDEPRRILEILKAWGKSKGVPVLASPVLDLQNFRAHIQQNGLKGLTLMGDWAQSPIAPKSSQPPPCLPPE
ncbi:MAG: hypothetical protein KF760_18230 [Candidatus Eremiobacteraeota bacterium]|nr:hypothetical protein [Candidatus Eremiobacteraeota bacterium]MCW5866734.1 hypothetical protein [Candidatus Eremiobacteraeota bacterium]